MLLNFCLKLNIERSERKNEEIQHLGHKNHRSLPLDPLVICHAKSNSNCIHKGKEKLGWGRRKVRHFCITTTSQIIGAAAAAPAAPLSTPLPLAVVNIHTNYQFYGHAMCEINI